MLVSSSHEATGEAGVWLRLRTLNLRLQLQDDGASRPRLLARCCHTFSASRLIISSVSFSRISDSNVSSAEIDCVGRLGSTGLLSTPSANSCRRTPYRPNRSWRIAISTLRMSPTVRTPISASLFCRDLAHAGQPIYSKWCKKCDRLLPA